MPGKYRAVHHGSCGWRNNGRESIHMIGGREVGVRAHTKVIHRNGRKSGKLWVQAKFRLHGDCYRGLITQLCRARPTGEPRLIICLHVESQCPFRPDRGGDMVRSGLETAQALKEHFVLKRELFCFCQTG